MTKMFKLALLYLQTRIFVLIYNHNKKKEAMMYNPDYFSKEKLEEIQMQDMYFDQIVIPAQNAYESLLRKYKKAPSAANRWVQIIKGLLLVCTKTKNISSYVKKNHDI